MNWQIAWQFLAGLGIFLFGMHLLEDALKKLAGRTFKLFLKKHTGNKLEAVFSGTVVTGILQSSSVVTLMVLAFVGAGVVSMRNGLAVVFGSNFGTTLDSWVVALVGFNFNIENLAIPIIAIGGLGFTFFKNNKIRSICEFAIGFGFLFFGLHFMKTAMEFMLTDFDFTPYSDYNRLFFVMLGFFITALIQSSSATMVIVLSALHTEAIPFDAAAGIVIGSELGTSMKIVLGSINGISAKKRIALGNTLFNIVVTIIAVVFMWPLIHLVNWITGEANPLIALVLFQSIINFTGLLIFYPLLDKLGDFLEKRFLKKLKNTTFFISELTADLPDLAMDGVEKEVKVFINRIVRLNMSAFHIKENLFPSYRFHLKEEEIFDIEKPFSENYEKTKEAEGEILSFYTKLRSERIEEEDIKILDNWMASVRNAMYSAKSLKDIRHNREDFGDSSEDLKYDYYIKFQKQLIEFYKGLNQIADEKNSKICKMEMVRILSKIEYEYRMSLKGIYKQAGEIGLTENDISSLLNVNMAIYTSCKSLIQSLKFLLLDEMEVRELDEIEIN